MLRAPPFDQPWDKGLIGVDEDNTEMQPSLLPRERQKASRDTVG